MVEEEEIELGRLAPLQVLAQRGQVLETLLLCVVVDLDVDLDSVELLHANVPVVLKLLQHISQAEEPVLIVGDLSGPLLLKEALEFVSHKLQEQVDGVLLSGQLVHFPLELRAVNEQEVVVSHVLVLQKPAIVYLLVSQVAELSLDVLVGRLFMSIVDVLESDAVVDVKGLLMVVPTFIVVAQIRQLPLVWILRK